jgi:16S rRNA (uracil1498-N3)-methyltransferase
LLSRAERGTVPVDRIMNLIIVDDADLGEAGIVKFTDGRAAHLKNVLRVTPGQQVRIGRLDGPLGVGTVVSAGDSSVVLQCAFESEMPARPVVDLLLAVPRPKVMRRLWAQLAALGVGQIILTNAEGVERPYFDTHILQEAHYRPLLIEGLQQARDTRLPTVSIHRQFRVLVEDQLEGLAGTGRRLVADPSGTTSIGAALVGVKPPRCLIAVGPESGWNAFELALLRQHGFELIGLGPRTLRVDTACTALLAIIHATLRDSRQPTWEAGAH